MKPVYTNIIIFHIFVELMVGFIHRFHCTCKSWLFNRHFCPSLWYVFCNYLNLICVS